MVYLCKLGRNQANGSQVYIIFSENFSYSSLCLTLKMRSKSLNPISFKDCPNDISMQVWEKSVHFSTRYPIYKTLTSKRGQGHKKVNMSLTYHNDIHMQVWLISIHWFKTYLIFRKKLTLKRWLSTLTEVKITKTREPIEIIPKIYLYKFWGQSSQQLKRQNHFRKNFTYFSPTVTLKLRSRSQKSKR